MAATKRPKTETKPPKKRSAAVTKRTKASKAKDSEEGMPVAETSVMEVPTAETSPVEVSTEVTPAVEIHGQEMSTAEETAVEEVSAEEIRKAKEILRSNGYLLIPYRKIGRGIGGLFCAGVGRVSGAWRRLCGWFSKKLAAIKERRAEKRRVAAEKKRLADEVAARHAEVVKNEMRLAELRIEEARLKAIAEPVKPSESEPIVQPMAESTEETEVREPEVVVPADSDIPKCATCGAELVLGARFCRKCGKPIAVSAASL